MNWNKLRIFHAVAEAGSVTNAGERLYLSQSAVSRHIRNLEETLNTSLFHRHARGLILTEQGELLFETTKLLTQSLNATTARIRDSKEKVLGNLRITTTTAFGALWLAPRLPKFYLAYPELIIDLMLEERVLDLPMREADVAIRMKEPSQADLIRKKLMSVKMGLYASPSYLETNGSPKTLDDMHNHRLIFQKPQVKAGLDLIETILSYSIHSTLTVNNYFGVLQATKHGLGIGLLPDYVTQEFEGIVRILNNIESVEVPVYLAYPEELKYSKRIAAFRDFMQSEINKTTSSGKQN